MNDHQTRLQFGLWESPFSPLRLARGLTFTDAAWDESGALVWREVRSDRGVLVLQEPDSQAHRELNAEHSVRARVGYGGGDFTVGHGYAYYIEAASGRIYRQPLAHGQAEAITPAFGQYASPALSPDGKWLLFVHTYEGQDVLGIVDAQGLRWPQKLVSGDDFYMQPVWHPDSQRLAWIAWNHPRMPWEGSRLQLGRLRFLDPETPTLDEVATLAGGDEVAVFQPAFSPDGRSLAYASDESGWWQLYAYELETGAHRRLTSVEADFALPAWIQGMRTFSFGPDGRRLFAVQNREGFASLWQIDLDSGKARRLPLDEAYTWLEQIAVCPRPEAGGGVRLALLASGVRTPPRLIALSLPANARTGRQASGGALAVRLLRRATVEDLSPETCAPAEAITWKGEDGGAVYGLFYRPHNPRFTAPGRPPLIVSVHGGPTSQSRAFFNPRAQFFATRGYAVLEVNYRGSTGYGRPYWQALNGNWGIYDVQDSVSGARHLVEQGWADGERLVVMGGSAGGFTVLQALEEFPGFFKAGICLYGVSNQFTLVAETHKFEARYSDSLLGPLPEAASIYRARSPVFHAEKIQDPLLIFQGEEDQVVPRAQSDSIVESLRQRGVPHEYHLYPGEGHGFRKTETLEHFYRTVERFLREHVIYA